MRSSSAAISDSSAGGPINYGGQYKHKTAAASRGRPRLLDDDEEGPVLAPDVQQQLLLFGAGPLLELGDAGNALAVDRHDDVALAQDARGRRARHDALDHDAAHFAHRGRVVLVDRGERRAGQARVQLAAAGLGDLLGVLADHDGDRPGLALAQHLHLDAVADAAQADQVAQLVEVAHFLAVGLEDDVLGLEARLGRRRVRHDLGDDRAARGRQVEGLGQLGRDVLAADADAPAHYRAVRDDLVHHVARQLGRDGEAQADVAGDAALRVEAGGVDADQLALEVHQRAAGVARVDRGVGLDEVLVAAAEAGAAGGADDAGGHGLAEAERVADRDHEVARSEERRVGKEWRAR